MLRLDDDADALGSRLRHHRIGDLLGHALLNLKAPCEHVDDARKLGNPENLTFRNVAYGAPAVERQHVMLTHRIKLDVLQYHHVISAAGEIGSVHDGFNVLAVAARQKREGLRDTLGSFLKTFTIGILSQFNKKALYKRGYFFLIRLFRFFHIQVLYHLLRHLRNSSIHVERRYC